MDTDKITNSSSSGSNGNTEDDQSIVNCVEESVGKELSSANANQTLTTFLSDKQTAGQVYRLIMDQIQANHQRFITNTKANKEESEKYLQVLLRAFRILKTKLPKFPPSQEHLKDFDELFKSIISSSKDNRILRPVLYLRAMILKISSTPSSNRMSTIKRQTLTAPAVLDKIARDERIKSMYTDGESEELENDSNDVELNVRAPIPTDCIIANMLSYRNKTITPASKKKTISLLLSDLFNGPLGFTVDRGGKKDLIYDDCMALSDWPSRDTILIVMEAKLNEKRVLETKQKVEERYSSAVSGKNESMFQFKYYSEQNSVELNQSQMDTLFDTFTSASFDEQPTEVRETVIGLIIKIIIDQYCTGDPLNYISLLGVFMEMLESSQESVQIRSFNLLVNVSIHAHLIEDLFPDEVVLMDDTMHDRKLKYNTESMRMKIVQNDLYDKLCDMLLWMVHRRQGSTNVWKCALNAFLFFVMVDGLVDKNRLDSVDSRVIKGFLVNSCPSERMEKCLIRMLLNKLYKNPLELDVDNELINQIGGINWIIDLYTSVDCAESRDNLFLIIYDYVVWDLDKRRNMNVAREQANYVLGFLSSLFSSQYLHQIFCNVPDRFVERFVRYIYIQEYKKDQQWSKLFGDMDKAALVAILYHLENIAKSRLQIKDELKKILEATGDDLRSTINDLISSKHADEQRQGMILLFELCKKERNESGKRNSSADYRLSRPLSLISNADSAASPKTLSNELMNDLLHSKDYRKRQMFFKVSNRLILDFKFTMSDSSTSKQKLFELVNEFLGEMVNDDMINTVPLDLLEYELTFILNHIILPTICIPATERAEFEMESKNSSMVDALIAGELIYKETLLQMIDISNLVKLFKIMRKRFESSIKLELEQGLLLHMIISELIYGNGGSQAVSDVVGGMAFFRDLVKSKNPYVSYLASAYLLQQLSAEKPAQFQAIIQKLSAKLAVSSQELLSNAYIAIQAIMSMSKA